MINICRASQAGGVAKIGHIWSNGRWACDQALFCDGWCTYFDQARDEAFDSHSRGAHEFEPTVVTVHHIL